MCYVRNKAPDSSYETEPILQGTASTSLPRVGTIVKCSAYHCGATFTSHSSLATHSVKIHGKYHTHRQSRGNKDILHQESSFDEDAEQVIETEAWEVADEDQEAKAVDEDSFSNDDDLGELLYHRNTNATASVYGTSMPTHSFLGSMSNRGSPRSPLTSLKKKSLGPASPKSFQTAQSSLASYATAPSGSQTSWRQYSMRTSQRTTMLSTEPSKAQSAIAYSSDEVAFLELSSEVMDEVMLCLSSWWRMQTGGMSNQIYDRHAGRIHKKMPLKSRIKLRDVVQQGLSIPGPMEPAELKALPSSLIPQLVERIAETRVAGTIMFDLREEHERARLCEKITGHVLRYLETRSLLKRITLPGEVSSSTWISHPYRKGIVLGGMEELNWSGRGQHIEYSPEDEQQVPLTYKRTLGHSQTAVVDSVRCRRIRLARKKIICNRRLKKEDAIVEVEHLTRLQHLHIVRVVGTYTLKRELAILLYPAAEWYLDKFMDELCDNVSLTQVHESNLEHGTQALVTFFGCLSNAIEYIHFENVKHMDIKPKNILVRQRKDGDYRVYIADFGIARAYMSAADAETDSPTSFTRTYAAPEVVDQGTRKFRADIFSLGCVFMEMVAVLSSGLTVNKVHDERQKLLDLRQSNPNSAFYANIDEVNQWYNTVVACYASNEPGGHSNRNHGLLRLGPAGVKIIPSMAQSLPGSRPSVSELKRLMATVDCSEYGSGPEPFEAAD